MHYCKRIRMFALQRLAVLLKFTTSQISQPEQLHGSAALLLLMTNSKAVWQLWHSALRAASRAFAWPILALLTEIKPGTAPGRAFFFCFWRMVGLCSSGFGGWNRAAPPLQVRPSSCHHLSLVFQLLLTLFISNINVSVVLRRTAHSVLVSLMLLFCSGWQCWLCKGYLML